MDDRQPVSLARRALSYLICYLIAVQPMLPAAAAAITPVTPGTQMDAAGNGVPVVNIATPNQAGVSHNQYQQYNVGQEGLILNNGTDRLTQTQLGGLIQSNPNLKAGREAGAIINEVVGASRSQLQGYTEVAGKAANVMVANPYGITCNGCGFINTPNVTLTTGKPQLDASGNLASLDVSKGSVIVEGQGLDGSNADAVSIVARATEINAGIHAKNLSLTLGANRVGQDGSVTPVAGEGAAPAVAVDTGALGGMYANRIHLVSSEKGVGVNLGNLNARQGDMVLDASGRLTVNNSLTSGAVSIKGQEVTLSGDHKAAGNITVQSDQAVALRNGALVSDGNLTVAAKNNLSASGVSMTAGRDIRLSGADIALDQASSGNAGMDVQLGAQNRIDNAGQLTAGNNLALSAQQAQNSGMLGAKAAQTLNADTVTNGGRLVADNLQVKARTVTNRGELLGGALTRVESSRLDNAPQGSITGANRLQIGGGALNNLGTFSAPELQLEGTQIDNGGLVQGSRSLLLSGSRLNNLAGGTLSSDNSFALNLPELNNSGLIHSAAELTLSGGRLINAGEINVASLNASNDSLSNLQGGLLLADAALQLRQQQLDNQGQIAARDLAVDAAQLTNGGTLQGSNSVKTRGDRLDNTGTLLSAGLLDIHATDLTNPGLLQGQQLQVQADRWQNSGNALSAGDAQLQAKNLNNGGSLLSQQAITLQTDRTENQGQLMASALTLHGDLINSGLIQGTTSLSLTGGDITNQRGGELLTGGELTVHGRALDNQGRMQADSLSLTAQRWQNHGTASATSRLNASVSDALNNSGSLLSEQAIDLQAKTLLNSGTLAADRLSLHAPQLTNGGLLQGNSTLTVDSAGIVNHGSLLSGGSLTLSPVILENNGLLQVADGLTISGRDVTNNGQVSARSLSAQLSGTLTNGQDARITAQQQAGLTAATLDNRGTLAATQLTLSGDTLQNRGLLQGDAALNAHFTTLNNLAGGTLLSGDELTLRGNHASNDGNWQAAKLGFVFDALANRGTINGNDINGTTHGELNNSGILLGGGHAELHADSLINGGKISADGLILRASTLNNGGLLQGSGSLDAQADTLATAAGSKTLSGGTLLLGAGQLTTAGTLQGAQATVGASRWQHQGSLLGSSDLQVSVSGELTNNGELLSHGGAHVDAQTLNNIGSLLSEQAMLLTGNQLNNSGNVQGSSLTITPATVINQGSLIGLQALTLSAMPQAAGRMLLRALAAPARVLTNNAGGALLTQGTLTVNGDTVTNNGSWQAQQILLNAQRLTNNGAIQSAEGMQLLLGDRLDSGAGSKISAGGGAVLQASNLAAQGQWMAKNLTLNGGTLNNNGEISGVDALAVNLSGALTQQQDKTLLTAGKLTLHAASLNNAGRVQGGSLEITSGAIDNNGRLQGDNNLLVTAGGRLTNNGNGSLLTQNTLTLTTPELYNYGLIQGGGTSNLRATGIASNAGRLLFGGELTLTTPQLVNSGWLQATQLILNASSSTNGGTLLADRQGTLTGNDFSNQGTAQGGNLTVNYQQLTNRGTLLGTNQLNISAAQVNQQAPGRLFSGGGLLLHSNGFDQSGQVVALGDATLELNNGFTGRDVIAAGNRLSISSNGAIDNQGTMQGQALTLSAGGDLTNNGQLTTGSGDSSLSGNRIALNGNGTLQGGGNVNLNSRSDITVDGFTGTRGSLLLSAPGSIVNNALLYAANNLSLYANSIRNQRADMLAGNSLWLQRDAAGNASAEVINTSGTIETQNGDITINTGHLLNTRDGLNTSEHVTQLAVPSWASGSNVIIPLSWFSPNDYGLYTSGAAQHHGHGDDWETYTGSYAPYPDADEQKIAFQEISVTVSANGGASRIAAGKDLNIRAMQLDNNASTILAANNIALSGNELNNKSWTDGSITAYQVYRYGVGFNAPRPEAKPRSYTSINSKGIGYTLDGAPVYEANGSGNIYRAVIQAGGNVSANFSGDISNTSTTANTGWGGNTLAAPGLNSFNTPGSVNAVRQQQLATTGKVAVNSPQWQDQLQNALQQVNGATGLDGVSATGVALTGHDASTPGNANLGKAADLKAVKDSGGQTLRPYQASLVDTSAYPLPSGNNGYFVASGDSKSPYLITLNPKLNGLGQLDQSLFGDLNALLGKRPGNAPQETRTQYTDVNAFLGSSYLLNRLNLKPDHDYRFLGDAAFDTRYVSNVVLNQTGSRYLKGIGSELDQMRYLMDNAAAAQQSLGLQFGVSLTAGQLAALDKSVLWWEASTVNGETVMVPKLYLSPKDVSLQNGSVIAGNNVSLKAGNLTNSGSSIVARNDLTLDSDNQIDNLSAGLMQAGNNLQLSALGDINNVGSTISGKTVALESVNGDINNLTATKAWSLNAGNGRGASKSFTETLSGPVAGIAALDSLSLKAGNNINITGASVKAGGDLLMDAWNDIAVTSNQLTSGNAQSGFKDGWRKVDATSTLTTRNQGSNISAGGNLAMQAGRNLDVTASSISAGKNAALAAGNDLNLNSAATAQNDVQGRRETHASGIDRTTLTSGGDLALKAGRDITSEAAGMAADGDVALQAGRDVNLLAAETGSGNSYKAGKKVEINESVRQQGTEIASGGSTRVSAGRDVVAEAAQVTASGDIAVGAGRDINLTTATDSDYAYREETKTKKGFLSKKTTHTIREDSATRENGTLLSGNNVALKAGNNLLVQGSQVVGDDNVTLKAGNNVDIVAATNTDSAWRFTETKKSGLMGTGGIGITIGSSKSVHDLRDRGTTQSQSASTVGSTGGNVSIVAGGQAHVSGSDLVAGKDLALSGDSVVIDPGRDKRTHDETFEQKKSGLTLALSGVVGEAINNAVAAAQTSKKESDGRLAALQATKAALSGVQAVLGGQLAEASADPNNGLGVSLSLTTQKSKSQQHQASDSVAGSTLNAGNNLSITSAGKGSGEHSGDIFIAGSQLKAAGDSSLNAARDIVLSGAANTQESSGKNSSSGGGVGISFGAGQGSAGISIFASVNGAKGKENGNGTRWSETTLDSGGRVSLNSGRDTTLNGAQVSGNQVTADVGRDLTITSQQDSDRYDSKQTSYGAGGSFTFGSMTVSGYASVNQDKMHSNFDSVQEQSGIYAGKGGFDITVGNHTQLNGAVIASQGDAADNRLDTGTLGFTDIGNAADYRVSHSGGSIALSSGGGMGAQMLSSVASNAASTLLSGLNNNGHAEGTTQSAVANGTVIIRDRTSQKQDVADLSRDTVHANDTISAIFDKEKEQKRLQTAQLAGEISGQMANIVTTMGDIKGLEAAKKSAAPLKQNATEEDRAQWLNGLRSSGAYQQEMKEWGVGSESQKVAQTIGSILTGLVTGNAGQAIAGGLNPWAAQLIKKETTDASGNVDVATNAMAHAVWGAVSAQMSGGNAAAGAAGAFSGELATRYIAGKYWGADTPEKIAALNQDDREQLSLLGTLAAGLAGGMAGNSSAAATSGAIAGKNAVENNLFGGTEEGQTKFVQQHGKDILSCADTPGGEVCQRGKAVDRALAAALAGGAAGGAAIAITSELTAVAQTAIGNCAKDPMVCFNEIAIWAAEMGMGDALPAGFGALAVGKMTKAQLEQLAEMKAFIAVKDKTGTKVTTSAFETITGNSSFDNGKTGTVFDSIKATQPLIAGTSIPKSFELNVNGQTIWVNPNATKHMGEYLTRNGLSHSTTGGSQAMLTSLQSAVQDASYQGIKYNEKMQIGSWELIFSQRPTDPYPVLKHALYK
ncbi:hemagluttinin repeat protein (plasmid) [Duffyella gerundensis]|nr:hemagglutinin repeat-containing protein [Duffyella gerundensis]UCB33447.1 hemagluttinin repeat protein [Duffyella gerundensis]